MIDQKKKIESRNGASVNTTLAEAVFDIVKTVDWVSFAELPRRLKEKGCVVAGGDYTLSLPGNLVVWGGMSEELVIAIISLVHGKRLFLHPASILIYLADGEGMRLPIAKQPPPGGYKKPRWLPCCLRTKPLEGMKRDSLAYGVKESENERP